MARDKGQVRRSQLITTYGVGAIMAVEDESFMVAGIDQWDVPTPNMHEPRLEKELRVDGFVLPPESGSGVKVPVVRFPLWYSCPGCDTLNEHRFFTGKWDNRCNACGQSLIPSRFVTVCRRGHIDDFPYFHWVHHGHPKAEDGGAHRMSIRALGNTASLRDIVISCDCGVSERSMEGAFGKFALAQIRKCQRRRPWLETADSVACDEVPRTLQRGASNVWFPILHSALSIPPWSEGAFRSINRAWRTLQHVPNEALAATITGMKLAEGTPYTVEDLVRAVQQRKARDQGDDSGPDSIKSEEYDALCRGAADRGVKADFVCVPAKTLGPVTSAWFSQVQVVSRLREVRAMSSFGRLLPPLPGDPPDYRAPLFEVDPRWLPGIEVSGEGVFMRLDQSYLEKWEVLPNVRNRVQRIHDNYAARLAGQGLKPSRVITPRLVLLHTLAHALINQFSLDSGYPAAALRERLYSSQEMCGLLIYTATSDSAGSFGGVAAQAESSRLDAALAEALERSSWCSGDPLCVEADAAGVDALNLAACHACVLLPEVSCEEMNVFLDRALLMGTPTNASIGYFSRAAVPTS
jgi:hypothetical protein